MASLSDFEESRRQFLLQSLALGLVGITGCAAPTSSSSSRAMGTPTELPPGQSVYQQAGEVTVNGVATTLETTVKAGDVIETGSFSQMVFVHGKDAFLLRSNTRLRLPTGKSGYNLEKGSALGVFAKRQTMIRTPTAIVGIRGTGIYLESEPDRSYVCTCYGVTDLQPSDDLTILEAITASHHDSPRYILADSSASERIVPAPFKNHDDEELLLIETLVGRSTPYVVPSGPKKLNRTYR